MSPQRDRETPEVVVAATGNLALVYFATHPGRLTGDAIERLYPGLIAGLAKHPGIGLVVTRSDTGTVELHAGTECVAIDHGAGPAEELLRPYGPTAADALLRVARFDNSGDLILLGPVGDERRPILSFEELVGSHGGLGGWQTHGFVLHPAEWPLDEPAVGATALYDYLSRWRKAIQADQPLDRPPRS